MSMRKNILKSVVFISILFVLLGILSGIFKPVLTGTGNTYGMEGFYNQPEDTIEVIFLGPSHVAQGITPMELYENYGISAYNLGTSTQPPLVSYYWMLETYELHSETLEVVVFDASMLRESTVKASYQMGLLGMDYSENKLEAVKDISSSLDGFVSYLSPIFNYHTRWKELKSNNFTFGADNSYSNTRGYYFTTGELLESYSYSEITVPSFYEDETVEAQEFDEEALIYFELMVEFCEENDIELILTKVLTRAWKDEAHNAASELADSYGLEFIDFNYEPILDEIDYNASMYFDDRSHLSYYGASAVTDWFGEYLTENCDVTDVRGLEGFEYMEEELAEYKKIVSSVALDEITDPCEYIESVNSYEDYSMLITVQEDGASALTEEQRTMFAALGLIELSTLETNASYIGVIESSEVVYENSERYMEGDDSGENISIIYEDKLLDGTSYQLTSVGGTAIGDSTSSCVIGGGEYSKENRGISIVVYDNESGEVAYNANFDTAVSATRTSTTSSIALEDMLESGATIDELTGTVRSLYLLNQKFNDSYTVATLEQELDETGFYQYLTTFLGNEDYFICLSVQGEASEGLDETARTAFASLGLVELSQLGYGDSYYAIIDGRDLISEVRSHDVNQIEMEFLDFRVVSGGTDSGNVSSIIIDDAEYSLNTPGINVVIYNKTTELVVDSKTFDTHTYPVVIE